MEGAAKVLLKWWVMASKWAQVGGEMPDAQGGKRGVKASKLQEVQNFPRGGR